MVNYVFRAFATVSVLGLSLSGCSGSGSSPTPAASSIPTSGTSTPTASGTPHGSPAPRDATPFGPVHAGSFHIGPVDFAETMWPNSCAPYPAQVANAEGVYLAGVDVSLNGDGSLCDACALVTTRLGKTALVRIVTTGVSKNSGDMDLSTEAYNAIHEDDPQGTSANPRPMTWQLAKCSAGSKILLQYQTEANSDWTSLWVRAARLPIQKLEVKGPKRPAFTALERAADGTFTDRSGFGEGSFDLRVTGTDGQTVVETFPNFPAGGVVEMKSQFQ